MARLKFKDITWDELSPIYEKYGLQNIGGTLYHRYLQENENREVKDFLNQYLINYTFKDKSSNLLKCFRLFV